MKALNTIALETGIMPILFPQEGCAERVVAAIENTDVPVVEILQRGEVAENVLKEAVSLKKNSYIGAGTVCTLDHCKKVVEECGADFIVAPGFNPEVVKWCVDRKIPVVPGVATPTEIMMALNYGVTLLKYFPFYELGGLNHLAAISGPFGDAKFVITGGTCDKEFPYLAHSKVAAVGGVWMFQSETDHTVVSQEEIEARINTSLALSRHYIAGGLM